MLPFFFFCTNNYNWIKEAEKKELLVEHTIYKDTNSAELIS